MRRWAVALAFALSVGLDASAIAQRETASWYIIVSESGSTLGHVSLEAVPDEGGRRLIENQELYLRERGGMPHRVRATTIMREDAAGRVHHIENTTRMGRFETHISARIVDGYAEIVHQTPSGRTQDRVAIPEGAHFDGGEALVRAWSPAETPRLTFLSFDSAAMAVERVVIEATSESGDVISAIRWRYDGDDLRGVARLRIVQGEIVEISQPMFGETFHIRQADRDTAVRRHAPYQVIPNMAARAPYQISPAARNGHLRFQYAFDESIRFDLPQTGEQRARADLEGITLDVCLACGPGLPVDAAYLDNARRSTPWMQSDHPRLQAMAAYVRDLDVSDARKMQLLLERAIPYVEEPDFNGHYSALDTLQRRSGDCTEAAVLLAALGRAAGIPTRVASGVVYSRQSYHGVANAFIPHSWVVAYVDGAWRSFDLALREFDSTHIALTIGDGDPRSIAAAGQLASLLRLDSMVEVRSRVAG